MIPPQRSSRQKLIIVLMAIGVLLFGFGVYYNQKVMSTGFKDFYQNAVSGKISSISTAKAIIIVKLDGHGDTEYIFTQQPNAALKMDVTASVHAGDSIYKKPLTDTVNVIYKRGGNAQFLIKKP